MSRTGAAKRVNIREAKAQLSRLIARALAGEDVVISRGNEPVVRLVPVAAAPVRRRFGAMKGRARVTDAFFEALPEAGE